MSTIGLRAGVRVPPLLRSEGEDGASVICQPEGNGLPDALQEGDYLVGTIRTGAALRSVRCSAMRYEDVNIWSSPGIAVNEDGGHAYLRVRATRRPRSWLKEVVGPGSEGPSRRASWR